MVACWRYIDNVLSWCESAAPLVQRAPHVSICLVWCPFLPVPRGGVQIGHPPRQFLPRIRAWFILRGLPWCETIMWVPWHSSEKPLFQTWVHGWLSPGMAFCWLSWCQHIIPRVGSVPWSPQELAQDGQPIPGRTLCARSSPLRTYSWVRRCLWHWGCPVKWHRSWEFTPYLLLPSIAMYLGDQFSVVLYKLSLRVDTR